MMVTLSGGRYLYGHLIGNQQEHYGITYMLHIIIQTWLKS